MSSLRRSQPLKVAPTSVCDALDATDVPAGAMSALTNLIPDPTTRNLFQCRPAALLKADFAAGGFASPGFVSTFDVIGSRVYGMIATARNAGRDEPFCFDLAAGAFIAIGGVIDPTTTPVSPVTLGPWTPPTMDLVGVQLMVTHPGFNGTGGVYVGWFDITDPDAPVWNAGNMGGMIAFTTAPSFVKNFNGRAYYIVNPPTGQPSLIFSDVLVALNTSNANQVLTFDDNEALTALGGLPLANQLGGIIQALVVFKNVSNIYQVTGDAASDNLAKNSLNIVTGTLAPNSVCSTPKGLAFVSPDGVRLINQQAVVSDPLGTAGSGITVPFTYAVVPSRISATCGGNVMRVSVQNGNAVGSPQQEYWYDFARSIWTGPHTFGASLMVPYLNSFVTAPVGVTGKLFQSDVVQTATSTFNENGTPLTFNWQTSMLPDTDQMCENNILETTIYMSLVSGTGNISVTATDQDNATLGAASVLVTGGSTIWGSFVWGQAPWQGLQSGLFPQQVAWPQPVVFRRMKIGAAGNSYYGFKIGRMHMRYEMLGYLQQVPAGG